MAGSSFFFKQIRMGTEGRNPVSENHLQLQRRKTCNHNIDMVAVSKGLCYLNPTILGYEPIMSLGKKILTIRFDRAVH